MDILGNPSSELNEGRQTGQLFLPRWHSLAAARCAHRAEPAGLEIIRLVETSSTSITKILAELGVPHSTFYRWYLRYQEMGPDSLANNKVGPRQFWNRIPEAVREQVVQTALEHPEKSLQELAWHMTDNEEYFISESSVYRIFKAYDLVTSPTFHMITAGDRVANTTMIGNTRVANGRKRLFLNPAEIHLGI